MSSPISCHALNTITGKPAAGLPVVLSLYLDPEPIVQFNATTNKDGRVTSWEETGMTVQEARDTIPHGFWTLTFDTGSWFSEQGVDCFYPEIVIKFRLDSDVPHYHVPLLLGPWSYTTYRGS